MFFEPGTKGVGRGRRGNWNKVLCLNFKGEPRWLALSSYHVGNYKYVTDEHKRVVSVSGQLVASTQDRNISQQNKVRKLVNPAGDQAGHLIACRFGGAGEAINMIPMRQKLNQGAWKALENQWAHLLSCGCCVVVEMTLIYDDVLPRPSKIIVESVFKEGSQTKREKCVFNN